jgi:hypothetical protein
MRLGFEGLTAIARTVIGAVLGAPISFRRRR